MKHGAVYICHAYLSRDYIVLDLVSPIESTKNLRLDFPSTLYPIIGCVGFVTLRASFAEKDVECNLISSLALISSTFCLR